MDAFRQPKFSYYMFCSQRPAEENKELIADSGPMVYIANEMTPYFFVESPIILFAAVIWFLRIYDNGRYCTFPHAIEFLNKRYEDIFPILTSYPELENYLSPFMDAWLGGAQDQLQVRP